MTQQIKQAAKLLVIALLCIPIYSNSQNIDITGKVIDINGTGLQGAIVHLTENGASTITNSDGEFNFLITNTNSVITETSTNEPQFINGELIFNVTDGNQHVKIDVYDLAGRQLSSPLSQQHQPGSYTFSINPYLDNESVQVNLIKVSIGKNTYRYKAITGSSHQPIIAPTSTPITQKTIRKGYRAATVDTILVNLADYDEAKVDIDSYTGYHEITLYQAGGYQASAYYMFPEPTIIPVDVPDSSIVDFRTVMNLNNYYYPTEFPEATIDSLNEWSKQLVQNNPFLGVTGDSVPWVNLDADVYNEDAYAFITQEQMAYLYLVTIFGDDTHPLGDTSMTGLDFNTHYDNGMHNYWMFSVMCLLTKLMDDDTYKNLYVGCSFGGYLHSEGMDYIWDNDLLDSAMAPLNVCYFDESDILVQDPKHPLQPEWCIQETSLEDLGASFHAVDIPGQTVVDIAGSCYGGGTNCTGCHIAGTQDETLPAFYPETIVWSFFMPQKVGNSALLCTPKSMIFWGVRSYVYGLNGNHRYVGGGCGLPKEPARQYMTDLISFDLNGTDIIMYDHSMTFIASQVTCHDYDDYWNIKRKNCSNYRCDPEKWDFCNWCGSDTTWLGQDDDTRLPQGVFDLQMHPPNNNHLIVAAFVIPTDANYSVSNLAIRRIYDEGPSVGFKIFDETQTLISQIISTTQTWTDDENAYDLGALTTGQKIYFAIDNVDGYSFDAAKMSWTVTSGGYTWNSYDVVMNDGIPQGTIDGGGLTANMEFYESTNDDGVEQGDLITAYNSGAHVEGFNKVSNYWGGPYPYIGKHTVGRGEEAFEITTTCGSPLADIGKWYGAFAPQSYHADLGDAFSKHLRRIGTFNWGAGVWFGDVEQYFVITWIGASFLEDVALDYYIFSSNCEVPGIQCALLKDDQCERCKALTDLSGFPLPSPGYDFDCSTQDVGDVYEILKNNSAGQSIEALKSAGQTHTHVLEGF